MRITLFPALQLTTRGRLRCEGIHYYIQSMEKSSILLTFLRDLYHAGALNISQQHVSHELIVETLLRTEILQI